MLLRLCLVVLSSIMFLGSAIAQDNDPAMRCGDAYVGQNCDVKGSRGVCKATICCERDEQGRIERSSCHNCARCVVSKQKKLPFGSNALPALRQRERLKKMKLPFARDGKPANASKGNKDEGVRGIVGFETVRRQTIPMKSRVPSVEIPDPLNLVVCLALVAFGALGALMALIRREEEV